MDYTKVITELIAWLDGEIADATHALQQSSSALCCSHDLSEEIGVLRRVRAKIASLRGEALPK